jgi:hypothetical protein
MNYSGSLLYMQSVVFIVHPRWLAGQHDQGGTWASHRGCTINAIDYMYSKLPPEDEWLTYSEHVEDIYWNKFKKKKLLFVSY